MLAVTLQLVADPETAGAKACCSPEVLQDARAAVRWLGIPPALHLEAHFRDRVSDRFLDDYVAGATPNPCIVCNTEVKFAAIIALAERLGATHLATGHYARIVEAGGPGRCSPRPPRGPDQATCSPARCRLSPHLGACSAR